MSVTIDEWNCSLKAMIYRFIQHRGNENLLLLKDLLQYQKK